MSKYGGNQVYQNYRGRSPKWKGVLAFFLLLVILISGLILYMQRYLVYDSAGRAHLEMPWQEKESEEDFPEPELTIEPPETPPSSRSQTAPEGQGADAAPPKDT